MFFYSSNKTNRSNSLITVLNSCLNYICENEHLPRIVALRELTKCLFRIDFNYLCYSEDSYNVSPQTMQTVEQEWKDRSTLFSNLEKGAAFDEFVDNIFRVSGNHNFTPRMIVDFMLDVFDWRNVKRVLDPFCGTGGILKAAIQRNRAVAIQGWDCDELSVMLSKLSMCYVLGFEDVIRKCNAFQTHSNIFLANEDLLIFDPPSDLWMSSGKSNWERLFYQIDGNCLGALVIPQRVLTNSTYKYIRYVLFRTIRLLNITILPKQTYRRYGLDEEKAILFFRKEDVLERKYEVTFSYADNIGLSELGLPTSKNDLPILSEEIHHWIYSKTAKNSMLLHTFEFKVDEDWYLQFSNRRNVRKFNDTYEQVPLYTLLFPNDEKIKISDSETYKLIKVRLHGKGIEERERRLGIYIQGSLHKVVNAGQIIISRLNAQDGAFGIIPQELDGAIMSSDFMSFNIDTQKIVPDYLIYVLQNDVALDILQRNTFGKGTRKRISQRAFLETRIPLPALDEQEELVKELKKIRRERDELKRRYEEEKNKFDNKITK